MEHDQAVYDDDDDSDEKIEGRGWKKTAEHHQSVKGQVIKHIISRKDGNKGKEAGANHNDSLFSE